MKREIEAAWRTENASEAQAKLEALANRLELKGYAAAAASLREGLFETLTCLRLGVDATLLPSLTNTNPLESTFSVHEQLSGSVKRWRNGWQVMRWVATALLQAESSYAIVGTPETRKRLAEKLESIANRRHAKSSEGGHEAA